MYQEYGLTCANHSDEDVVLMQIGWLQFTCPICSKKGIEYSIGRKIIVTGRPISPEALLIKPLQIC